MKAQPLQVASGGPEDLLQEPQFPVGFQGRRMQGRGKGLGDNVLRVEIFENRTLVLKGFDFVSHASGEVGNRAGVRIRRSHQDRADAEAQDIGGQSISVRRYRPFFK